MENPHENLVDQICSNCKTGYLEIPPDEHPSYCLCNTCGAIHLTYEPMDHQMEFHSVPYEYNKDGTIKTQTFGLFGGYGSAKSTAGLQEFFLRCLENPNGVGLISAPTLQLLKRTSIKTLLDEIIPPPLLKSYHKTESEITLINNFAIYGIPADDETKLRSLNAGLVHLEEASGIKRTIYDQILSRLRNKFTKNRCVIVSSNPENNWIKDVLVDNDKRKDPNHPAHDDYDETIKNFIWATHLNYHLPSDFIPRLSKGKPQWWIDKFLQGSFDVASGLVYPDAEKAIIEDIPNFAQISKNWEKVVAADFGIRNPTAVLFGAINPESGEVIIYDCYYQPNQLLPEHAKAIKPKVDAIPAGRLRFMVGDPSMRNRSADVMTGKNVQELYQDYGLYFSEGNNRMEAGILRVNSYIIRGRLKVFRSCVDLAKELIGYKYKEVTMDDADSKNLDERPIKNKDHAVDALRYLCMRLPENPDELVNESYDPQNDYKNDYKAREVEKFFNDEDDEGEDDVINGYLSYV